MEACTQPGTRTARRNAPPGVVGRSRSGSSIAWPGGAGTGFTTTTVSGTCADAVPAPPTQSSVPSATGVKRARKAFIDLVAPGPRVPAAKTRLEWRERVGIEPTQAPFRASARGLKPRRATRPPPPPRDRKLEEGATE